MKVANLMVAAILSTAAVTPALAGDPCAAVLCLATSINPMECKDAVDGYFEIRVYHEKKGKRIFDPGATAMKRYSEVMDQCEEAEQSDKDRVNAKFGTLEYSPLGF